MFQSGFSQGFMEKTYLQNSGKEKICFDLLEHIFYFTESCQQPGEKNPVFLSGNSVALLYLRRHIAANDLPPPEALLKFLAEEYTQYISLGVCCSKAYNQLKQLFEPIKNIGPYVILKGIQGRQSHVTRLTLDATSFTLKISSPDGSDVIQVKFYLDTWFSAPNFEGLRQYHFNNQDLNLIDRVTKPFKSSPIQILGQSDLMLLKYFSTQAPVTHKVLMHNQKILDDLTLSLENAGNLKTLNMFHEQKNAISQKMQASTRISLLKRLGFSDVQIDHLREAYHFVENLFKVTHSKRNIYHNICHTDFVLQHTLEIVEKHFPSLNFKLELALAAIFHDCNLGLDSDRVSETVCSFLSHNQSGSTACLDFWEPKLKQAEFIEDEAGIIGEFFCSQHLGMSENEACRVRDFVRYTHLGSKIQREGQGQNDMCLGRAILQIADIFQVTQGDFALFLKNNWHLMYELDGDPLQWFESTKSMLDQLLDSAENLRFCQPLFNINILQFDFRDKNLFQSNLVKGLRSNRLQWIEQGLQKCLDWQLEKVELYNKDMLTPRG